jgi:hypothetical protein
MLFNYLSNQETQALLPVMERTLIEEMDLILDRRTVAAICLLSTSMVREIKHGQ